MTGDARSPNREIILYQTEDGRIRVECRFEHEMFWMSEALMAELIHTSPQKITLHLKALYSEGEIDEQVSSRIGFGPLRA